MRKGKVKANIQKGVHADEGDKKRFMLDRGRRCKKRPHTSEGAYTNRMILKGLVSIGRRHVRNGGVGDHVEKSRHVLKSKINGRGG